MTDTALNILGNYIGPTRKDQNQSRVWLHEQQATSDLSSKTYLHMLYCGKIGWGFG